MSKKQRKNGFTLVELAIVIAVIAILIAVLVPTFTALISKANQSSDSQLVSNLNTSITSDQAINGEYDNATEAITALREDGYDLSKLTPTADGADIVYNASTHLFVYYTDDFAKLSYGEVNSGDTLVVITDGTLSRAAEASVLSNTIEYCVYSTSNVTVNTESNSYADGVTIYVYTESGSSTINATNVSTVNRYGASAADEVSVAVTSYHLYGSVETLTLTYGHVKLESGSQTGTLNINSATNTKLTYSDNAYIAEIYTVSGFNEIYNENDTETKVDTATLSASLGAEVGAMLTNDNFISTLAKSGSYKLTEDITISTITIESNISVILDLNGYTITTSGGIPVKGALTINDSSADASGSLVYTGSKNAIEVESGSFTLNAGTIYAEVESGSDQSYGVYCSDGGSAIINGGAIYSCSASLGGNNTTGDMSFTINGGTLTAAYGPALFMPGQFSLNITGGVLNGGISLRMGNINISGGTINAVVDTDNIDSPENYYAYSGNAWLPDALYVFGGTYTSDNETYGNSLNLIITGGTFNCTNGQGSAIAIYDIGKVAQTMNVTISGGEFNTNSESRSAYQVLSLTDIGVESPQTGYGNSEYTGKVSTTITGGTFSSTPLAYLGTDYTVTTDTDGKYVVSKKSS